MDNIQKIDIFNFIDDEEIERLKIEVEKIKTTEPTTPATEWILYTYEELIRNYERQIDFKMIAHYFTSIVEQVPKGTPIESKREEIMKVVKTKCYHYGNMEKGLYIYSFKEEYQSGGKSYYLMFDNGEYVVTIRVDNIDNVLMGKELICFPACALDIFDKNGNWINSGYGKHKNDIRYKILCDSWKILDFSINRIGNSKPKDFYECQFKWEDLTKYWGEL